MVFQDFDHISERRRVERQRKFRKRVTIAAITAFVLLVLIASGIFAVFTIKKKGESSDLARGDTSPKDIARSKKIIQTICNGTKYKTSCKDTLSSAAQKNRSLDEPHEFLEVAISAISDEIEKALNNANGLKLDTDEEKAALKVCKKLIEDSKEELKQSISQVGTKNLLEKLTVNAGELSIWLSAVMSYQQTCIDAFPEGESKSKVEKKLNITKQLTSNSLAIIQQFSSYISSLMQTTGSSRRLLESLPQSLDKDGAPTWMSLEDRRVLEGGETDKPRPHVTVAKDGSGNFQSISDALEAMPKKRDERYVIYVKEGVYEETVTVTEEMTKVTIYGDGSQKSIITGGKNVAEGVNMYDTATIAVTGEGFLAKSMGFRNTAGPEKRQAVAARVQSDHAIFVNCRFEGYQNTLWVQAHRQFYRNVVVVGTIDFIFGDAAAIFQNTLITVRKPLDDQQNSIVAQGRLDNFETTGIVLQNCRIEPHESLESVKNDVKSYLGRPWKEYSRTIIIESTIGDFMQPEGWLASKGDFGVNTVYFAEYNNKGAGANTNSRVKWPGFKTIDKQEATKYTVGTFFPGDWITKTGTPVHLGLFD